MSKLMALANRRFRMGNGDYGLVATSGRGILKHFANHDGDVTVCSICKREIDCGWFNTYTKESYCLDCVDLRVR